MSDSKRIQFEFSAEMVHRLDDIKRRTGRSSYAEVVRDAIRLLEWWVTQDHAGYDTGLVKDDELTKIVVIKFC